MPVISRRPTLINRENGEVILVFSEAARFSVPSFMVRDGADNGNGIPLIQQLAVWPMGSRLTYFMQTSFGVNSQSPTPVLVLYSSANSGARPMNTALLHNAIDPVIQYDLTTKTVHMFWWWNAWSPDFKNEWVNRELGSPIEGADDTGVLPRPPLDYYAQHSPPDERSAAWARSVVPKSGLFTFDPRRIFWVAPVMDGYMYDYFPKDSNIIGESKVGGPNRMPDTPGARHLQSLISRDLIWWPSPEEKLSVTTAPSEERVLWEKLGGIRSAGAYLRIASRYDSPEFISKPGHDELTGEIEMAYLPGWDEDIPQVCNIEDFLIIVNALTAHLSIRNLVNTTRVLMYATGQVMEGVSLETIPRVLHSFNVSGEVSKNHPVWPANKETVRDQAILVLDHPKVVGQFPIKTNYRNTVNADMVVFPEIDFVEVGSMFFNDGRMVDTGTGRSQFAPAMDWSLMDPTPAQATNFDVYRDNIDLRSY